MGIWHRFTERSRLGTGGRLQRCAEAMIWVVIILSMFLVGSWIALWIIGTRRIAKVYGQPTSEDAKISLEAEKKTKDISDKSARDTKEVENADRRTLFDLAAARLRRRK